MSRSVSPENLLLSGGATLIVLAVAAIVLSLGHMGETPTAMGIHPYLVEWCQAGQNVNFLSQREAHAAALVCCALLILAGSKLASRISQLKAPQLLNTLATILVSGFCLLSVLWWANQPVSKLGWAVTSMAIVALSFLARAMPRTLMLMPALAGLLAIIPGLMVPYDASWMSPNVFIEFQQGYSVVSSQCDRISMGHHIFEAVKPNYGVLMQVLSGFWEKQFGIFTLGQNIQIIRWLQALTVMFAFIVYAWYSRNRPFPTTLALMLMLPWLHTNQISLLFPNLSPWRSFGFPLAAICLIACMKLPEKLRYLCMGLAAGVCLALNLETGIAILIGFLSFIYFSNHEAGKLFPLGFFKGAFGCCLGAAAFLLCLYFFIFLALGYFPNMEAYLRHLKTLQYMTKTGYAGGFKLQFSPIPVFFFCHYCYVLFRASLSTRSLTPRECFRAFAATTALVWSVYYFNRPNEWYFQPQYFFYAVLLIDVARITQSKEWTSKTFERRSVAILCLICVISPQMVLASENALPSYLAMIKQWRKGKLSEKNAQLISGIYVHPEAAKELNAKAKVLEVETSRGNVLYLTGSTVLIPKLTGLYLKTDFDDPFQELTYVRFTNDFIEKIKHSGLDKILVDAEDSYLAGDRFRRACWQYFEAKLAPDFKFAENENGWRVLVRVTPKDTTTNDIGLEKAKNLQAGACIPYFR